jgi:hypothetical protein
MIPYNTEIYTISELIPDHSVTVLVEIIGIGFWTTHIYNDNTKSWHDPFTGKLWTKINEKDMWFYLPKE